MSIMSPRTGSHTTTRRSLLGRDLMTIAKRNEILQEMGFDSYRDYLNSELWCQIRDHIFLIKGRKCCCCGKKATTIHHAKYTEESLDGSSHSDLFPVCGACHNKIHFKGERFRTLHQARQSLKSRHKSHGKSRSVRRQMKEMEHDRLYHEQMCQR